LWEAGVSLREPPVDYVRDAGPLYQDLRQVLVQLAAFMLGRLTSENRRFVDVAPVELAREALRECRQGLADLRVPADAAHHRRHLGAAADALDHAIAAAMSCGESGDELFFALQEAERHLKVLGRLLPGFEPVDFTQACCAAHARGALGALACRPSIDQGEDHGSIFNLGA
jgi:hypothetical protein